MDAANDAIRAEAAKLRDQESAINISKGMMSSNLSNCSAPCGISSNEVMESVGPITSSVSAGLISHTANVNNMPIVD